MKQPLRNLILASIISASSASLSIGQSADDGDEEIFNLDPFVVGADEGYQSRNSLSATKFAIAVKEVPITVSSITQEFLQDTYSQNLEDAVRFSAGVTLDASVSAEEQGTFYIRGLRTARAKRNGVIMLFTQDMTNVEKVEVVKGPMSLLYGQVEPGGIVNYITMNALPEFRTSLDFRYGNNDHYRVQLNHTGPIFDGDNDGKGRLLYRVDTSYKRDGGWRQNTEDERTFYSGVLEYKPFAKTTIELQYDFLNQNSYNAAPLPAINSQWRDIWVDLVADTPPEELRFLQLMASQDPFATYAFSKNSLGFYQADNSVPRIWDAYAEHWDWSVNTVPLNAFNDIFFEVGSIEIKQQLTEQWFAKFFVVHNTINRESIWGQPWAIGLSGESGAGYSSNHWDRYNDDYAVQLEVTGKWDLFGVENQTIIGAEYLDDHFEAFLAVDGNSFVLRPEIWNSIQDNPLNPYFNPAVNPTNLGTILFTKSDDLAPWIDEEKETKAAFISNIARFFNSRFLILSGLRFDDITIQSFQTNDEGVREETSFFNESNVSPQIGSSFEINENLSIYASYSESFVPQSGTIPVLKSEADLALELPKDPSSRQLTDAVSKNPKLGEGYEIGVKFDAFDEVVSGSFAAFKTELSGVEKTFFVTVPGFIDASGRPQTALIGSQNNGREIEGLETELFIKIIPGMQTVFTYAYIDSAEILATEVVDIRSGNNVTLSIPSVTVPRHQIGMWTKYSFDEGKLDGFSLGGGFSWVDKRFGNYDLRSDNPSAANFVGSSESVERRILLEDQIVWELYLAYNMELNGIDWDFQLNVKNLFDDTFVLPGGMPNEPQRIFASVKMSF